MGDRLALRWVEIGEQALDLVGPDLDRRAEGWLGMSPPFSGVAISWSCSARATNRA